MSQFPGARSLLETAVEDSPNGVLVCDAQGKILYVNRRIQELFGVSAEELLGEAIDLLFDESVLGVATPATSRELLGRRRDGSKVPVEVGLAVASGSDQGLVVASV